MLALGQQVTLLTQEVDHDEHDNERITPAGSVWVVLDAQALNGGGIQYMLGCPATGACIYVDASQLLDG